MATKRKNVKALAKTEKKTGKLGPTQKKRTSLEIDPSIGNTLVKLIEVGLPRSEACSAAGITTRTLRMWKQRESKEEPLFVELFQRIKLAESRYESNLLENMHRLSKGKGQVARQSTEFLLRVHNPRRYGPKAQLDVNVTASAFAPGVLAKASDEDLDAALAANEKLRVIDVEAIE